MAKIELQIDALNLDVVKYIFQILKDVAKDDRVSDEVKKEITNKVKSIIKHDDE